MFRYLLIADVLEVGIVEVHGRQNAKCYKVDISFKYILLAEVLEVGVVEVHEGVLEPSDLFGSLLDIILSGIAH